MTRRKPDNSKMINILNKDLITLDEGIELMLKHLILAPDVWNQWRISKGFN